MPRYKVNLDLYIVAEDAEEVQHVILGMADCFDYNSAYFAHRSAITELPEEDVE